MKKLLLLPLYLLSAAVIALILLWGILFVGRPGQSGAAAPVQVALMDKYELYMQNQLSNALQGILKLEKVYWLSDSDVVAPEPDPAKFGVSQDAGAVAPVLEQAQKLLDGQKTLFSADTQILEGSQVHYYLDETILCISWQQQIGSAIFTFSEVKIAHPSQFRRFLADGTYGSGKQYYCTQMAATVNAVTASNADFYKHRPYGIVVYNSQVYRTDNRVDTCFIDGQGALKLVHRGELPDAAAVESYVQENDIRFSLSFGPILVEDGVNVAPEKYPVGQINDPYSRAALGSLGELHYVLVTAGFGQTSGMMYTIREFAGILADLGCQQAYALDGGQTGTIVTGGQLMNRPDYGTERAVSDIIYFATALPSGG